MNKESSYYAKEMPVLIKPYLFFRLINITTPEKCWEWKGSKSSKGYGLYATYDTGKAVNYRAHRLAYFYMKNDLSSKMAIDHICKNRLCCNPAHLRQVEHEWNSMNNSDSVAVVNLLKTHCKHGHDLTGNNLRIDHRGNRACRACAKIYREKRKQEKLG